MIGKMDGLKSIFEGVDLTTLPRKDKEEILKKLREIKKVPPWKRNDVITALKNIVKKLKTRGYQKVLEEPKLLAVIKYG